MPISDFRKKKLEYVFKVFFDTDHSGNIEKDDFQLMVENICKIRGWSAGEARYKDVQERLLDIWDGLQKGADSNNDNAVSTEEWCEMWEKFAENKKALDWQKNYMNFIFDLQDTSGDGSVDEGEFTSVCTGYGVPAEECAKAFQKLSKNNTVTVTRDTFGTLWNEYFCSDDPKSPGNFIFGKSSF